MTQRAFPEAYCTIVGSNGITETDPERVCASELAAARCDQLRRAGWEERERRPTSPGSPATISLRGPFGRYRDWNPGLVGHWMDHPYRLVNKSTFQNRSGRSFRQIKAHPK